MTTKNETKHTPGPWSAKDYDGIVRVYDKTDREVTSVGASNYPRVVEDANLISAAPELLAEAKILRMLVTSPRFSRLSIEEALEELRENGITHDDGAAIAKAEGR